MTYLQDNSAFISSGSSRCVPHSGQCDEISCSLAKQFEDAEGYAQCPIYYDHWRTGVQSVLHNGQTLMKFIELFCPMTNCRMCRRIVMEHWPNANEKRCSNIKSTCATSKYTSIALKFCTRCFLITSQYFTKGRSKNPTFIFYRHPNVHVYTPVLLSNRRSPPCSIAFYRTCWPVHSTVKFCILQFFKHMTSSVRRHTACLVLMIYLNK